MSLDTIPGMILGIIHGMSLNISLGTSLDTRPAMNLDTILDIILGIIPGMSLNTTIRMSPGINQKISPKMRILISLLYLRTLMKYSRNIVIC